MRKKIFLSVILAAMIFAAGCAQTSIKINRFSPVSEPPFTNIHIKDNETFITYEDEKFSVTAALFEYNSVVLMPLTINNKTRTDIKTEDYSISLRDGRDLKVISMLARDDLIAAKAKMEGNGPSGGIQQQVIENTLNAIMDVTNISEKRMIMSGMDQAINDYFQFRPIYAGETREGVICFFADFKFEYPITLIVKLGEEKIKLLFLPQKG